MATVPPNNITIRRPVLEVWGPPVFMLLMMVGFVWYVHRYLIPLAKPANPVIDVAAEGKAYGLDRLKNYAKFSRAMAADIHARKSLDASLTAFHDGLAAANKAAFTMRFGPVLAAIVPEGTEPTTDDQWARIEQFYAEVANGVEEIKGVK